MDLTDAEREILARTPEDFASMDAGDQPGLWSLQQRELVESRPRPAELPALAEMEWRLTRQGVVARGGFSGNG